jgi:thiol:disulfide interchange protein
MHQKVTPTSCLTKIIQNDVVIIPYIQILPIPGAWPQKPGSATFPFFGVQVFLLQLIVKELRFLKLVIIIFCEICSRHSTNIHLYSHAASYCG